MEKSPDAFRTISEVAEWLDTPAHVLRFWESKFAQVKPIKRAGGRRYYRPADMALLGGLKKLLHEDGLSIKGAQALIREQGVKHVAAMSQPLEFEEETDVVEAMAEAPEPALPEAPQTPSEPARGINDRPPLVLGGQSAAKDEEPEDAEEADDDAQPQLPFLHRGYTGAQQDRAPLLRSGAEALDAAAPAAPAEEPAAPEPEPLTVPRLAALRRALKAAKPSPETRAEITARLEALRAAMAEDRTG